MLLLCDVVVCCCCVLLCVVVVCCCVLLNGNTILKEEFIDKGGDLSDFFVDFRRKNVYFCFTSNENCHFSVVKRLPPKTGC